ncbi:MAG: signal peptidase I [Lachnospiraceae bacterium]|nr:signal peptidase I [Lachnospiraceae bacterium]
MKEKREKVMATPAAKGAVMYNGDAKKKETLKEGFIRRVKDNTKSRWIRFGVVSLIFFAWVVWMNNYWFLLLYPLLFDIYITGYIPFTWWKKDKRPWVRKTMSWVDAIVYALVLVYFVFGFLGQNYMIPSSSLEKTLLTGDYLVVDKVTYGPRVPITPINFPLVHNTIPKLGIDSYLDWPENDYRRLPGLRSVEENDIVVFNFPAGDTVATKYEETSNYYDLVKQFGKAAVTTDKSRFGDIKHRPVDRRVNYVKRCVGLPGDTFKIVNDVITINGEPRKQPEHVQFAYFVGINQPLSKEYIDQLGITPSDVVMLDTNNELSGSLMRGYNYLYWLPLTSEMKANLESIGAKAIKVSDVRKQPLELMFAEEISQGWTLSDWGGSQGVVIPKKGMSVEMNDRNWHLYKRAIRVYEGNPDAKYENGKLYIGGNEMDSYTFKMDYYFMMGDNRDLSLDSRFWGFVPEDHIVGRPLLVLASFDRENGGVRWNRIFRSPNPDK